MALRDEIGEARLEDVPALVAQMERLQEVSLTPRATCRRSWSIPASPYFGHLRLREQVAGRGAVERDVLHRPRHLRRRRRARQHRRLAARAGQPALLSLRRGERLRGAVRRPRRRGRDPRPAHADHRRRRAAARRLPAGDLGAARGRDDAWPGSAPTCRRTSSPAARRPHAPARDAAARRAGRGARRPAGAGPPPARDRGAASIRASSTLITARDAGVVVIQGGAGSGKTTVGLHRLAYLAYTLSATGSRRGRMVVVTQGVALAAYIGAAAAVAGRRRACA